MQDKCYYCKKECLAEYYLNPWTKEHHPTCGDCILDLSTYFKGRKAFANVGCFVAPFFFVCSVLAFFLFGWKLGVTMIAVSIGALITSHIGIESLNKKHQQKITQIKEETMQEHRKILDDILDTIEKSEAKE